MTATLLGIITALVITTLYFMKKYEDGKLELLHLANNYKRSLEREDEISEALSRSIKANVKLVHEAREYVKGLERIQKENTRLAMSFFTYMPNVKSVTELVDDTYKRVREIGKREAG